VTERAREQRERDDQPAATTKPPKPDPVERPRRPAGVELAAAIMIVSGAVATLVSIQAAMVLANQGELDEPLAALSIALGVGSVVLGLLVRVGRAWLIAVNVAAVAGFLEITSFSAPGLLFGLMDVLVVALLLRDRPWFTGPEADAEAGEGR
jgi:hypothetical protein